MELDYDPSIKVSGRKAVFHDCPRRTYQKTRSGGSGSFSSIRRPFFRLAKKVDVTGFNIPYKKLTFIGVPETLDVVDEDCIKPNTMEGTCSPLPFMRCMSF